MAVCGVLCLDHRLWPVDPPHSLLISVGQVERVAEKMAKRAFNLPNMLTYARILAVPLVVLCFFLEGRLQSSDFARWSALIIFIAGHRSPIISTAIWRAPGSRRPISAACSIRSPTSLLVADLPAAAGRRHRPHPHRRLVALGGDHHPVPRNPGLGPARISGGAEGQRCR